MIDYRQLKADRVSIGSFVENMQLNQSEWEWISATLSRLGGYPSLKEIWELMDETWDELGCDQSAIDRRIDLFYSHPVWLLNGLFIEQHEESLTHREYFADWVAEQVPLRVADIGGGFGSLARMIGLRCPTAEVHIVEPHPHQVAVSRTELSPNIRFSGELVGEYDILIATDVFEHVPDPLNVVADSARHLRVGGKYLIANCFFPVIKCHLPQTFHFRYSWDQALDVMGLKPGISIRYGRVFTKRGPLSLPSARLIEARSKRLFPWLEGTPGRLRRSLARRLFLRGAS